MLSKELLSILKKGSMSPEKIRECQKNISMAALENATIPNLELYAMYVIYGKDGKIVDVLPILAGSDTDTDAEEVTGDTLQNDCEAEATPEHLEPLITKDTMLNLGSKEIPNVFLGILVSTGMAASDIDSFRHQINIAAAASENPQDVEMQALYIYYDNAGNVMAVFPMLSDHELSPSDLLQILSDYDAHLYAGYHKDTVLGSLLDDTDALDASSMRGGSILDRLFSK